MGLAHGHGHGHHAHHGAHGHGAHAHGHHHHGHAHGTSDPERAISWALALNFAFLIVETAVGFLSGSIAVLSDAGHMVADVAALVIALAAQRLSRVGGDATYTFGLRRLPILGGLANALTLNAIVVIIVIAAFGRLRTPALIAPTPVLLVGALGLGVNLLGAWILHRRGGHGVNVRGALLHLLADALGSIGVIVSGAVIATTGWVLIDPLVSLFIAALIALGTWPLFRDLVRTMLLGSPASLALEDVRDVFTREDEVRCLEDFHIWELDTDYVVLSARVHAQVGSLEGAEALRRRITARLKSEFRIQHVTIEVGPHEEGHEHGQNDCLRSVK